MRRRQGAGTDSRHRILTSIKHRAHTMECNGNARNYRYLGLPPEGRAGGGLRPPTYLKRVSVMSVTERPAGSGMVVVSVQTARLMKTIFLVMVLAFAFTTGMAVTTIIALTVS